MVLFATRPQQLQQQQQQLEHVSGGIYARHARAPSNKSRREHIAPAGESRKITRHPAHHPPPPPPAPCAQHLHFEMRARRFPNIHLLFERACCPAAWRCTTITAQLRDAQQTAARPADPTQPREFRRKSESRADENPNRFLVRRRRRRRRMIDWHRDSGIGNRDSERRERDRTHTHQFSTHNQLGVNLRTIIIMLAAPD